MGGITVSGHNISIVRGDSGKLCLDLYMGIDLFKMAVGDSGVLTVKKRIEDDDIVLQKPMNSDASFTFSPEDTKDIAPGKYVYDIQLTLSTGEVVTVFIGKFRVTPDVTTRVIG